VLGSEVFAHGKNQGPDSWQLPRPAQRAGPRRRESSASHRSFAVACRHLLSLGLADVVLDPLAVRCIHQKPSAKRRTQPDTDADHSDGLDVAVADAPVDRTQADMMRVSPSDQERAMTTRLRGPHGDDPSVWTDRDGQHNMWVAGRSRKLLGDFASTDGEHQHTRYQWNAY
jgi:hypothetical protein